MTNAQATHTVLMIRPVAFGFNPQTATDNHFQQKTEMLAGEIQKAALLEFDHFVATLRSNGIHVLVVEDTLEPLTPDSIFPNNWVTFHDDGRVGLYPMLAENRRNERRPEILEFVVESGFDIDLVEDFRDAEEEFIYLEGTGSMVLDRENKICYAALSERTHPDLVVEFCEVFDYQPIVFTAFTMRNNQRHGIYHTNIVLSVMSQLAFVGVDSIDIEERDHVLKMLTETNKEIIGLSQAQIEQFAGNVLELQNDNGEHFIVMSSTAYQSLKAEQLAVIKNKAKIIEVPLTTIETVGGGGARCMLAEIFLPKLL